METRMNQPKTEATVPAGAFTTALWNFLMSFSNGLPADYPTRPEVAKREKEPQVANRPTDRASQPLWERDPWLFKAITSLM